MQTRNSAATAHARSISTTTAAREITKARLEESTAFVREREFFDKCTVDVKVTVRRNKAETDTTLTLNGTVRDHDEDAAVPVRDDLVGAVAIELGLTLGGRDEVRLRRRLRSALAQSWGRVSAEVERQVNDPAKLGQAWEKYGQSHLGGAVSAMRARINRKDPEILEKIASMQANGVLDEAPAGDADARIIRRIMKTSATTKDQIVETANNEIVRHVLLT